jgi:hypothetical protein
VPETRYVRDKPTKAEAYQNLGERLQRLAYASRDSQERKRLLELVSLYEGWAVADDMT